MLVLNEQIGDVGGDTEGFTTPDLVDAAAMLETLA
jgi:hypothetical protein